MSTPSDNTEHVAGPSYEALVALIEPVCLDLGYELVEIDHRQSLLRIYIDVLEGVGRVTLDDCAKLSREVSALLDVEDPILQKYDLEVSSPGIERPLRKPEHFRVVIGQDVKVALVLGLAGRRNFKGQLIEVSESGSSVTVDVDGTLFELPLTDLSSAKLIPDWSALMKSQGKRAQEG